MLEIQHCLQVIENPGEKKDMADQTFTVTEDDVRTMLLAGDSIVGQAGRSMLAKY